MSAILRIIGLILDATDAAAHHKLMPYRIEKKNVGRAKVDCRHYLVAEETNSWPALCKAISTFLKKHDAEIRELVSAKGIENAVLDIAVNYSEKAAAKYIRVGNGTLRQLSELGLDLEISIYTAK